MNFAIIENEKVTNVIVADSQATAEALYPGAEIIAVTEKTNPASVGGEWLAKSGKFASARPFASWVLDEATGSWNAPVPYPKDGKGHTWDEDSKSWKEIEIPAA
jgi:hypothetical protein